MIVTVDTNVLIAAFVARGVCHDLFEHLVRYHTVVCSERILVEYRRVLLSKFGIAEKKVAEAEEMVRSRSLVVECGPIERISRDEDDDWVISAAVAPSSRCLLSGDEDLLAIGEYKGIRIIRPNDFWEFEERVTGEDTELG